jgi:hypothetical protein
MQLWTRPERCLRDEGAAEIQTTAARLGFEQRLVLLALAGSEEMHDLLSASLQELGNQAPVAPPPERLRAHEAGGRLRKHLSERRLPSRSAHAGGIAAKRGNAKTVERVLAGLAGEATAELDNMPVRDPAFLEHRSERRLVELGVVTRARKPSHVDQRADAGLLEDRHELFRRPCPMTDRPHDHRGTIPAWTGSSMRRFAEALPTLAKRYART